MNTLKSLTKKPIYAIDPGIEIGKATDILVDPETHKIALVVLSYGDIPETSVVCEAESIGEFGNTNLTIEGLSKLHLAVHDKASLDDLERGISLRKRTVMTPEGQTLGSISRTEVDERGNVLQYRLRKPRFGLLRPTFALKPEEVQKLGHGVVVVGPTKRSKSPRPPRSSST